MRVTNWFLKDWVKARSRIGSIKTVGKPIKRAWFYLQTVDSKKLSHRRTVLYIVVICIIYRCICMFYSSCDSFFSVEKISMLVQV